MSGKQKTKKPDNVAKRPHKEVTKQPPGISGRMIPTGLPSDYKADERILAPIPGVVRRVFVAAGDRVKAGQALLVIEAMKMKNTLRSGHDLQVAAVHVEEGEVVKAGKILVEFEIGGNAVTVEDV